MENKIFELDAVGKKIAFLEQNRAIDPTNVKSKIESLKKFGICSPLMVQDATDDSIRNITIYDADTNAIVEDKDRSGYLVVIDGQHRYKAMLEIKKENKSNTNVYSIPVLRPLNTNAAITDLISEINATSINWSAKNYVEVLAKSYPDNTSYAFLNKYMSLTPDKKEKSNYPNNGYPLSTVGKYLTLDSSINKDLIKGILRRMPNKKLPDNADPERAEQIIKSALSAGFTHKFLAKRYFIDWFAQKKLEKDGYTVDVILDAVSKLDKESVKAIIDNADAENYLEIFKNHINLS